MTKCYATNDFLVSIPKTLDTGSVYVIGISIDHILISVTKCLGTLTKRRWIYFGSWLLPMVHLLRVSKSVVR